MAGTHAALAVLENRSARQDLNGDGDRSDTVLYVYDLLTGVATNTMQAMHRNKFEMDADNVVILTSEGAQRVDLNNDGDHGDHVVQVWNFATSTLTSTGYDATSFTFAADHIAISVGERRQGAGDLNGDSDQKDEILHLYRISTATTENLGYAIHRPDLRVKISEKALMFTVLEGRDGLGDLNGDGRKNDEVAKLFVFDSSTLYDLNLPTSARNMAVGNEIAALSVSEKEQGDVDLNGDGDTKDDVVHVVDLATGAVTNLAAQGDLPAITGRAVVFRSIENAAGQVDLNSDGDRSDRVLRVYDNGAVTTLDSAKRFRRRWYQIGGTRVVFVSKERRAGGVDKNDDGDVRDNIVQVYDIATATLTNSGLQAKAYVVGPDMVAVATIERKQGRIDFNGDGDTRRDIALNVFHMPTATVIPIPVAIQWKSMAVADRYVAFAAREKTHFDQILNGDSDASDDVLFCAGPLP